MKQGAKSVITLTVICLTVALLVAITNNFTAPIIEKSKQEAAQASLYQVLEGAEGFQLLEKPSDAPESVIQIYSETSGLGYAVNVSVTSAYSSSPMLYTVGIGKDGIIKNIVITDYTESKDFGKEEYPKSYIGLDSALNGANLVAGVTYSSAAFKQGVDDVFQTLIAMGLIGEGEKSEEQKISELLNTAVPGALNGSGVGAFEEISVGADWVKKAYAAKNGAGYLLISQQNEVFAINAFGSVCVFDIDGNVTDGTEDMKISAAEAVKNNADENREKHLNAIAALVSEDAVLEQITDIKSLSTVVNAFSVSDGEKEYYGFVCAPVGFGNGTMTVYCILDGNGRIETVRVEEIILKSEHYDDYELDEDSYYLGLEGKDKQTLSKDDTLISGATVSADAIKKALNDAFAAFENIKEGA